MCTDPPLHHAAPATSLHTDLRKDFQSIAQAEGMCMTDAGVTVHGPVAKRKNLLRNCGRCGTDGKPNGGARVRSAARYYARRAPMAIRARRGRRRSPLHA